MGSGGTTSSSHSVREESRFLRILLISSIAEMLGEFENTLIIEMGADNASRVRERE
jgi:DNA repair protein SbcC/Rad50